MNKVVLKPNLLLLYACTAIATFYALPSEANFKCGDNTCKADQKCWVEKEQTPPKIVTTCNKDNPDSNKYRAASEKEMEEWIADAAPTESSRSGADLHEKTEDCEYGQNLESGLGCKQTRDIVSYAKAADKVSQFAGSTATQVIAQKNSAEAAAEGTMSAQMKAAGDTQVTSGKIQMLSGAVNTMAALSQYNLAKKHEKQEKRVKTEVSGNNVNVTPTQGGIIVTGKPGLAENAVRNFKLQGRADAKSEADTIGNRAATEQKNAADAAKAGAFNSLLTGTQQMVSGGFNIAAGNNIKNAANELKKAEKTGTGSGNTAIDGTAVEVPTVPGQATAIVGDGSEPVTVAAKDESEDEETGSLGRPINVDKPADMPAGPEAQKLGYGQGGGGSGGGGGGSLGSGSTSAAPASDDGQATSRMAENQRSPNLYEGTGAMVGGGGGQKGDSGSGSPDFAALLKQFMPGDEEKANMQNTILDMGGRAPAGEAPFTPLGANINIFERIHKTYQEKAEKGFVGFK